MLRVTDDTPARPRHWPAALGVLALAACALGLRGRTPDALAGPVVPARLVEKKDRPPLDPSFLFPTDHADEVGVYAIRLGEVVRTPGMEKVAETYDGAIKAMVGEKEVHFRLADVEQVGGRVTITHDPKKPAPNRSMALSLTSVRMANEFDWVKQLKAWTTDWTEHAHAGGKFYSGKVSVPLLGFVDKAVWFYQPDKRTVVVESEENIKKLIEKKGKAPAAAWAGDWQAVEGGTFAVVLTDVKGKLAKKVSDDEQSEDAVQQAALKAVAGVCTKATRAAVGIDLGDGFAVRVRLACATGPDAADVDEGCQAIVRVAKAAIEGDKHEPKDAVEKAGKALSAQLLRGVEFGTTVDHVVEVRMSAPGGLADLLKAFGAVAK